MKVDTILFDLGGVLIDWNPRYLYRKLFESEDEMEYFLKEVADMEWNEQQDAGRPFEEAIQLLTEQHPKYTNEIESYFFRWKEMLNGPIEGTLEIFRQLKRKKELPIYALTNWSAQTFPIARELYPFLGWFDGILVSGEEKMKKPAHRIYHLTTERFQINPATTLFIDDSLRNVNAAIECGYQAVQFESPEKLSVLLSELEILNQ